MVFEKATDITTNIWVLTNLRKGSFFQNLTVGNDLLNQTKLSNQKIAAYKQMIEDSLQPLLVCGRATSIAVTCERDTTDQNRLNYKVEAKQPDGLIITYTDFYRVV